MQHRVLTLVHSEAGRHLGVGDGPLLKPRGWVFIFPSKGHGAQVDLDGPQPLINGIVGGGGGRPLEFHLWFRFPVYGED